MAKDKANVATDEQVAEKPETEPPEEPRVEEPPPEEPKAWEPDFDSPITKTVLHKFRVYCTDGTFPELIGFAVDESDAIRLAKLVHGAQVDGRKFEAEKVHD